MNRKRAKKPKKRPLPLMERIKANLPPGSEFAVVDTPVNMPKLSERILDLAIPFLEAFGNPDNRIATENILHMAVLAWNLTLMPEKDRAVALGKFLDKVSAPEELEAGLSLVGAMADMKEAVFPDDRRYVSGYKIRFKGREPFLKVAYLRVSKNGLSDLTDA